MRGLLCKVLSILHANAGLTETYQVPAGTGPTSATGFLLMSQLYSVQDLRTVPDTLKPFFAFGTGPSF